MQTEKATFGAGCFWGVEETFRNLKGVLSTSVGYAGGTLENPTYRDVCTDKTGHAEVVQVEFDPAQVSYDQLLDVFRSWLETHIGSLRMGHRRFHDIRQHDGLRSSHSER